jgi:uncharacterized protein
MADTPGFNARLVRDLEKGEILDGGARYLMIRADTLMGMFSRLPAVEAAAALDALKSSTIENGARSAQTYHASLPSGDRTRLLDVIAATAPQLGWGSWRFSEVTSETLVLEVLNSPFVAGYGEANAPVCHAIAGMLTASAGIVFGRPVVAVETQCAVEHGVEACRFEVSPEPSSDQP